MSRSPKERVVHMIGNAHIDPVWLWQWPEGYQEVRSSFQSAIDRMEEYPEFVFTADSVLYLAWVEENDPELFEAIRRRVADGRWQLVGGWWVEPDCNIPSGESFVRQALYGQRWLKERFGVIATTGANFDPFGHNATIPQILRRSGMDSYIFLRPGPHELTLPGQVFWWVGPDGSRVLAYRIPFEYGSAGIDLGYQVDKSLAQVPPELAELMVFYGVGNHGGGPTRANLDSIRRLNAMDGLPEIRCSSPRAFFDSVARNGAEIPEHAGELQHHCVGCYTAHSGVKRWNRRAENLLLRAEKWASVADVVAGAPYPLAELTEAWKLVLFNQFHDTLAGTAIEPAYDDSRDQLGHASSIAAWAFNRAVQAISRRIEIPVEPNTAPIVVFNPHPWPVAADVELEFAGFRDERDRMTDHDGAPVPVQRTRSYTTLNGPRGRVVFPAELPPLGYRVYRLQPGGSAAEPAVTATDTTLENEFLALEVDPATGWLSRLEDRTTGVSLLPGEPGSHAVVIDDQSDTWSHWVRAYDDEIGRFECTSARLVEHGPVRAVLRIASRYNASTLIEEISLGSRARHVDVRAVLDWRERQRLLKLRFPTAVETNTATYEIPYGHIERPATGDEEPAQAWVDVSGEIDGRGAGLALLNDGKYGFDVRGGDIGMTFARSPVYAWHVPKVLDEDGIYDYLDQGRQELRYRLVPHAGDRRAAGVVRLAAELNQPPFPLLESYHDGDLPGRASYASVDEPAVLMTVLKEAEDGDGALVVRAYESEGRAARAAIDLPLVERTVEADFGPLEIKTFRVPRDPSAPVEETNLLEWPESELPTQPAVHAEPGEPPAEIAEPPELELGAHEGPALGTDDVPPER